MTYTKYLDISGDFKHMVAGKNVIFICICCHLMKQCKNELSLLYFGFYRDDQAVLLGFLLILATLEISQYAEISLAPVLFIHLNSTIFSDILRVAPFSINMSSMINVVSGLSLLFNFSNLYRNNETLQDELSIIKAAPVVPIQTQANNLSSLAIKVGTFCDFCHDQTNLLYNHKHINCGMMVRK
ncbi:hypothetical protein C8R48DRAFT_779080 [Suillus tomentosus]|nr:hypothetical protein C8R48DRAFT_779080 [Suillus tomentosus]